MEIHYDFDRIDVGSVYLYQNEPVEVYAKQDQFILIRRCFEGEVIGQIVPNRLYYIKELDGIECDIQPEQYYMWNRVCVKVIEVAGNKALIARPGSRQVYGWTDNVSLYRYTNNLKFLDYVITALEAYAKDKGLCQKL